VSPGVAHALAQALNVPLQLIPYPGPGVLADAIVDNVWDIANIACEKERAKTIHFSPAYCEIQATYLLPPGSPIRSLEEVDRPGVRIVTKARGAYDLWLTENIRNATILRAPSIEESFQMFCDGKYEVLSGLRPRLLSDKYQECDDVDIDDMFFPGRDFQAPLYSLDVSLSSNRPLAAGKIYLRLLSSWKSLYWRQGLVVDWWRD